MTAPVIPRAVALANARAVLDRARLRIATDRAAGRLAPAIELHLRRIERDHRPAQQAARVAA